MSKRGVISLSVHTWATVNWRWFAQLLSITRRDQRQLRVTSQSRSGADERSMAMSLEENKAIVRRYIEVGWSTGDMSVVEEAVAPHYRRHQPNMVMSVESEKEVGELLALYRGGIPDLHTQHHPKLPP